MTTAIVEVRASFSSHVGGAPLFTPATQSFSDSCGEMEFLNLANGANTITRPTSPGASGATGVFIVPPTANSTSIILKGVSGDTGVRISPNTPTWVPFDAASLPTNFVLTAGGAINNVLFVWV